MIPAYVRRQKPIQEVPTDLRYHGGLPVDWDPMIPIYFIKKWGYVILPHVWDRYNFTMPLEQPHPTMMAIEDLDVHTVTIYRYYVSFAFEHRRGDDERIVVHPATPKDLEAIRKWTHDARELEEGPG